MKRIALMVALLCICTVAGCGRNTPKEEEEVVSTEGYLYKIDNGLIKQLFVFEKKGNFWRVTRPCSLETKEVSSHIYYRRWVDIRDFTLYNEDGTLLTEKGGSENEIPIDMFSHTDEPKPCQN